MQRIITLCDLCFSTEREVEAAAKTFLQVNGAQTELDLCSGCAMELQRVVAPYFEEGRIPEKSPEVKVRKPRRSTIKYGEFPCDVTGCEHVPLTTAQGYAQHIMRSHPAEWTKRKKAKELKAKKLKAAS